MTDSDFDLDFSFDEDSNKPVTTTATTIVLPDVKPPQQQEEGEEKEVKEKQDVVVVNNNNDNTKNRKKKRKTIKEDHDLESQLFNGGDELETGSGGEDEDGDEDDDKYIKRVKRAKDCEERRMYATVTRHHEDESDSKLTYFGSLATPRIVEETKLKLEKKLEFNWGRQKSVFNSMLRGFANTRYKGDQYDENFWKAFCGDTLGYGSKNYQGDISVFRDFFTNTMAKQLKLPAFITKAANAFKRIPRIKGQPNKNSAKWMKVYNDLGKSIDYSWLELALACSHVLKGDNVQDIEAISEDEESRLDDDLEEIEHIADVDEFMKHYNSVYVKEFTRRGKPKEFITKFKTEFRKLVDTCLGLVDEHNKSRKKKSEKILLEEDQLLLIYEPCDDPESNHPGSGPLQEKIVNKVVEFFNDTYHVQAPNQTRNVYLERMSQLKGSSKSIPSSALSPASKTNGTDVSDISMDDDDLDSVDDLDDDELSHGEEQDDDDDDEDEDEDEDDDAREVVEEEEGGDGDEDEDDDGSVDLNGYSSGEFWNGKNVSKENVTSDLEKPKKEKKQQKISKKKDVQEKESDSDSEEDEDEDKDKKNKKNKKNDKQSTIPPPPKLDKEITRKKNVYKFTHIGKAGTAPNNRLRLIHLHPSNFSTVQNVKTGQFVMASYKSISNAVYIFDDESAVAELFMKWMSGKITHAKDEIIQDFRDYVRTYLTFDPDAAIDVVSYTTPNGIAIHQKFFPSVDSIREKAVKWYKQQQQDHQPTLSTTTASVSSSNGATKNVKGNEVVSRAILLKKKFNEVIDYFKSKAKNVTKEKQKISFQSTLKVVEECCNNDLPMNERMKKLEAYIVDKQSKGEFKGLKPLFCFLPLLFDDVIEVNILSE